MTTDVGHVSLSYLSFLAEQGEWRALVALLCEPLEFRQCRLSPVDTRIEVLLERIDQRLARFGELRNLFHIVLLSASLRYPRECPTAVASFLAERGVPDALLSGVDLPALPAGMWTVAPMVLALGQEAEIRYFVVGLDPGAGGSVRLPLWAEPLLNDTAKQAIADAAAAALQVLNPQRTVGFCCFPLCLPNGSVQIRGRSLCLPLGLAFVSLLSGEKPTRVIAATGDLAPDGTVRKVGGIDLKSACLAATPRRFRALLFPAENEAPCRCEGLELLPVSSLEEALMFAGIYRPGKADLLLQLLAMLRDPGRFIDDCRALDPTWIRWAVSRGKLASIAEKIATSPELFESLVTRLREALESWDLNLAAAISSVISPDHFQSSAEPAPQAAFEWCTQNIALANHTGDIAGAADWVRKSDSFVERIWQVDVEAVAEHFNHRIVSLHNRYRFVPEVPSELEGRLSLLENQLSLKKQAGVHGDKILGRLYGTIGQQFAFCGSSYIETALDYFKKARSALGEGTVPDLKPEWMRQLNYEAFAYLDAGRFDEARQRVCAYLEVSGLNAVRPEAIAIERPWKHNLLTRSLADAPDVVLCRNYLSWAKKVGFVLPNSEHPWQLWAFNTGRIAFVLGETEAAATSFKISLELCLKAMPTIRVMALLGLAGLARIKALPENLPEIESGVVRIAAELNPDHFADVLKVPFEQVLEQVWREPGSLFPFSYH